MWDLTKATPLIESDIEEEKSLAPGGGDLNPLLLCHGACGLPLCYNCCLNRVSYSSSRLILVEILQQDESPLVVEHVMRGPTQCS